MPLPSRKITAFAKDVSDMPTKTSGAYTAEQAKAQFDAAPNEVRVALNATIDDLGSTTAGDSGAKNIGVSPIPGVTGDDVQEVLEDLKSQINGAVAGTIPDGTITEPKLAAEVVAKFVPYGGITANVGDAYSLAYPITALNTGFGISLQINVNSTAAATLNVDGKGAKPIKKANGTNVTNLQSGGIYTVRYNGTAFILQGEGGEYGTAGSGEVLTGYTVGRDTGVVAGTLALTGDATDADVVSGKTYYNTDAKTKRTGTGAAAKKIQQGTTTSATTTTSFTNTLDGTVNLYAVTVAGLTFTPSVIMINNSGTFKNYEVSYNSETAASQYGRHVRTQQGQSIKVTGSAYVTSTGFQLPVDAGGLSLTWKAYE